MSTPEAAGLEREHHCNDEAAACTHDEAHKNRFGHTCKHIFSGPMVARVTPGVLM